MAPPEGLMDNQTARLMASLADRSELAPEDTAELTNFLAANPTLAAEVEADRAFDAQLAQRMKDVPIPEGLKGRLLDHVAIQKGAWYRQKAWGLVGLAAAVMIATGGLLALRLSTAPELDPAVVIVPFDEHYQDPAGEISRFLAKRGLNFEPARPFNMNMADRPVMAELQGREVPMIVFRNQTKNATAKVFVVRDTQFNWKNLPQDGSLVPSIYGHQVAIIPHATRRDIAYIVVFSGDSLDLFLDKPAEL
jgi:hypothetical protein